jgi:hypothetical protein
MILESTDFPNSREFPPITSLPVLFVLGEGPSPTGSWLVATRCNLPALSTLGKLVLPAATRGLALLPVPSGPGTIILASTSRTSSDGAGHIVKLCQFFGWEKDHVMMSSTTLLVMMDGHAQLLFRTHVTDII